MIPRDLTGQKFGKLTVTGKSVRPARGDGRGVGFKVPVLCACGRKELVWYHHITRGRAQGCGNCLTPNGLPASEGDFR